MRPEASVTARRATVSWTLPWKEDDTCSHVNRSSKWRAARAEMKNLDKKRAPEKSWESEPSDTDINNYLISLKVLITNSTPFKFVEIFIDDKKRHVVTDEKETTRKMEDDRERMRSRIVSPIVCDYSLLSLIVTHLAITLITLYRVGPGGTWRFLGYPCTLTIETA